MYFFQSGTTTPQNAFQDQALLIPFPNPIVLDASGRVPFFYLADGNIKIRLTDNLGVTVIAADGLLVIGPSSGGGGVSVDPNTVLATGDMKARYGTGVLSGFVRANGRTIGSATSGGTERANADAQTLFEYLWNADANLAVSGGRGASANADWLANKTIALPDLRGRAMYGMDDMGAAAAGRLTTAGFGAAGTTLGNAGGAETRTLVANNLPTHTHSLASAAAVSAGGHSHTIANSVNTPSVKRYNTLPGATLSGGGTPVWVDQTDVPVADYTHNHTMDVQGAHTHAFTNTDNNTTTNAAVAVATPGVVMTFYIKL